MKSEKGITGIDLSISIIIIMLFVSIIAALSINVSTSIASKRRLDIATECMEKIMEKMDSMDYSNVEDNISEMTIINEDLNTNGYDSDSLRASIATLLNSDSKYNVLDVYLKTENYKPEGKTSNLVKRVTVRIEYKLNKQTENIEVTRLKTRYNADLEALSLPSPTATATPSPAPTITPTP